MLLNKKTENNETDDDTLFLEGVFYINSGQWLLAYLVFEKIIDTKEKTVPVLFNMALCSFYAKKYKNTISNLEEALRLSSFVNTPTIRNKPIPEALLENEYSSNHYKKSLTLSITEINQAEIKLRIRRLLIDTHTEVGNWKEVIRLSALPDMDKCENVKVALEKAKSFTINTQ